jgi:hypothetical protein
MEAGVGYLAREFEIQEEKRKEMEMFEPNTKTSEPSHKGLSVRLHGRLSSQR